MFDNEILKCMLRFFDIGLVVEFFGCVVLVVILNNKILDVVGKWVVVVVIGSNVMLLEMSLYI